MHLVHLPPGIFQGWKMASEKPRFLGFLEKKPLKSQKSKIQVFLGFLFLMKFYTNHI